MKQNRKTQKFITSLELLLSLTICLSATNAIAGVTEDTNKLLNWAEKNYPHLFLPPNQPTLEWNQYLYRYYPATKSYAGIDKNKLTVHVVGDAFGKGVLYVDTLKSLLAFMNANPIVENITGTGQCVELGKEENGTVTKHSLYFLSEPNSTILQSETTTLIETDSYAKYKSSTYKFDNGVLTTSWEDESEHEFHLSNGYWYADLDRWYHETTNHLDQTVDIESFVDVHHSPGAPTAPQLFCQGGTWENPPARFTTTETWKYTGKYYADEGSDTYDDYSPRDFGFIEAVNQIITTPAGTFNTIRTRESGEDDYGYSIDWTSINTGTTVLSLYYDPDGNIMDVTILESIQ